MAKNIQIFFVYNTSRNEIDNGLESILYFYPEWVSDDQKGALCGQIIGTIQCMKNLFSKPDIISLQNGKFLVIESKKVYFVLGTDKHAPTKFLQYIAKNLYSTLKFFHLDIDILDSVSKSNGTLQKLHNILDGYLKILNFSGKLCSQTPGTKKLNDIFIEAIQILECCKTTKHVLGGIIVYRNRLIATQVCTLLTQLLVLSGTGNVQYPPIQNNLPFGLSSEVQLYEVFIAHKEYSKLLKDIKESNIFEQLNAGGGIKKKPPKIPQKNTDNSVLSVMKREQSLIFTSVPEEESLPVSKQPPTFSTTKKNRPRFLNLESTVSKKPLKQFNIPHSSSQIIVCNTPLQEQKKIVHFNPLLICNNEILHQKKDSNGKVFQRKESCTTNSIPFERKSVYYKTLADPIYPHFKPDGTSMSRYLFEETRLRDSHVCKSYEDLDLPKKIPNGKIGPIGGKMSVLPKSNSFFNCKFKASKDDKSKKPTMPKPNFDFQYKCRKNGDSDASDTIHKCLLFIWQHEDIALTMILKRDACEEKETFTSLEDICTKHLSKLERKMRNNIHLQNVQQEKELNKFIILDSYSQFGYQDMLWNGTDDEWRNLNYFNRELNSVNLSEVLVRCEDNVLYGYHCGPTKIFYSETSVCNGGLPLPTDPLGIMQIKAKRRLERDCAFVLL